MLAPLAAAAEAFLPESSVMFEVACSGGVPDVVLLDLDADALAERGDRAPLQHSVDVLVMLLLQTSPAMPVPLPVLAGECHVSVGHLRRRGVPRLVAGGHVLDGWEQHGLVGSYQFRSLARRVVTLEAKLRDWRGGLAQAVRHTAIADEAWLVVDEAAVKPAAANAGHFTLFDVGLASLSRDGEVRRLVEPQVNRSRQPARELLVERAVGLRQAGQVSGPLPRVFGEVLAASDGNDPRLAPA